MGGMPIACAVIDTSAFKHNFNLAKKLSGNAEVIPVIKANAYGHGAYEIAKLCASLGAKTAGLARVNEGVQLRKAGIKKLSLAILGGFIKSEAEEIVKNSLEPSLFSVNEALILQKESAKMGKKTKVHIKINTGMNRLGLRPEEAESFIKAVKGMPNLEISSMYTHLPCADEQKDKMSVKQFLLLKSASSCCPEIKLHASNSAGIARYGSAGFDAVRPGIMLYGSLYGPFNIKLKPVMSIYATVVQVVNLKKGEGVSYGLTYRAKKSERAAVISIGYGDGYPRTLGNKGRVLINGKSFPVIGRVCMDMIIARVDSTVKPGDTAVIIGKSGKNEITAEEIARMSGTISYEIFTGVAERVVRIYK